MRTFLFALFFSTPLLHSYVFTQDFKQGIYWAKFPILLSEISIENDSLLKMIVQDCELEWESELGQEIWDISSGTSSNKIRWSNNLGDETGYDEESTLAVTIRYRKGTYFERVEIILNGKNQELRQNLGGILYKTVLHELGHTIGLDHTEEPAIMQAMISPIDHLQLDDIEGGLAVMTENQYRQSIRYVSPLSSTKESHSAVSCGTIDVDDSDQGNGPYNFALSFVFGVIVIYLTRSLQYRGKIFSPLS